LWSALTEFPVAKKTLMEKGKALLKKDNLLDESLAEKVEFKQKPLHEQLAHFQQVNLTPLGEKLDSLYKSYNTFLNEIKTTFKEFENEKN
jgi:cyclic nucleotide gated channel alpha 3